MKFVGLTALSVDIRTNVSTLVSIAASRHDFVPNMLLITPSKDFLLLTVHAYKQLYDKSYLLQKFHKVS